MRFPLGIVAFAASLAVPAVALADEIHVPGDFRRLQVAIDAAQPGDVIVLDRGRHRGPFHIRTNDLTIEGRGGMIVGRGSRRSTRGVDFALSVVAPRFTVRGVTFIRGSIRAYAGGMTIDGCTFVRCDTRSSSPRAIKFTGNGTRLTGNVVVGGGYNLAPIFGEGDDVLVEGNMLFAHRNHRGIVVIGDRVSVVGNSISGEQTRAGIVVAGDEALVRENEIMDIDGSIDGWLNVGIDVDGDHAVVDGNLVEGSWLRGPSIVVEGSDGVVEDNDVTAAAATGIVSRGDRNRLLRNRVTGVTPLGINRGTRGHGIVVRGGANVLNGNDVVGTPADGIRVLEGLGNTIDGCRSTGSDACGILNAAPETAVTGSTFLSNGTDVVNVGSFTVFDGNDFHSGTTEETPFGGGLTRNEDFGNGFTPNEFED